MSVWVFFNCFFDVEPANVMSEVCFQAEELGEYFNLCENNWVSHHTMTLGAGDLRKMSNTSCNTDCYILVVGRASTLPLGTWGLSPIGQQFVYTLETERHFLGRTFNLECVSSCAGSSLPCCLSCVSSAITRLGVAESGRAWASWNNSSTSDALFKGCSLSDTFEF